MRGTPPYLMRPTRGFFFFYRVARVSLENRGVPLARPGLAALAGRAQVVGERGDVNVLPSMQKETRDNAKNLLENHDKWA